MVLLLISYQKLSNLVRQHNSVFTYLLELCLNLCIRFDPY